MLRTTFLWLSRRRGLKSFILRRKFARRVAERFVAGETLDAAINVTRSLNARGFKVTLDYLGESVGNREQAAHATDAYVETLRRIAEERVDSGISIKLSQIGLAFDEDFCRENLRRIGETARDLDSFVRIDMEGSDWTERTLHLFAEVSSEFPNIGVVIQSYLRRSEEDVRRLCVRGAPVRLCKGAYKEPEGVAFQRKSDVDESYVHLLKVLADCGAPLAVATHDDRMIDAAKRLNRNRSDGAAPFEFQMLYGVRRELQARLVEEGYRMRVYVPFGSEWYAYFMRRMAERPANTMFVLRALLGK